MVEHTYIKQCHKILLSLMIIKGCRTPFQTALTYDNFIIDSQYLI